MTIRIALFDSGLGGLTVYKEIKKKIAHLEVFYFADHAFCPYGPKPLEEIRERCRTITEHLAKNRVELIVVACNTATTLAIHHLRQTFPEIAFVGIEPFVKYIRYEIHLHNNQFRPAFLSTINTTQSERFKELRQELDPDEILTVYPLPTLATFIEENIHRRNEKQFQLELEQILAPLKHQGHDWAILGCTHYPLIARDIERILKLKTISPEPYVAQRVVQLLEGMGHTIEQPQEEPHYLDLFHFESSGIVTHLDEKLKVIFSNS